MTNHNQPWTIEDDMKLLYMAENGYTWIEMREELGRTANGLQTRLTRLVLPRTFKQLEWLTKEPE